MEFWTVVGVALAFVGIGLTVYFGMRSRRSRKISLSQNQTKSPEAKQSQTLNIGNEDP